MHVPHFRSSLTTLILENWGYFFPQRLCVYLRSVLHNEPRNKRNRYFTIVKWRLRYRSRSLNDINGKLIRDFLLVFHCTYSVCAYFLSLLSRSAVLGYDLAISGVSVCLSVTRWCWVKTNNRRIVRFSLTDSLRTPLLRPIFTALLTGTPTTNPNSGKPRLENHIGPYTSVLTAHRRFIAAHPLLWCFVRVRK